jgi:hypothetical protein
MTPATKKAKTELEALIEKVKKKPKASYDTGSVILTCTGPEWDETLDFLQQFDGHLPPALDRMLQGGKVLRSRS